MKKPEPVIIEISGGVAVCVQKPAGIGLIIIDHDNPSEEVFQPEDVVRG